MAFRRVVVTGLGAITPIGSTAPTYWDGLRQGVSGAGPITRFDATKFKTRFACEVKEYSPDNYFDRKEGRKMDLFTQFAVIASDEAILDAGLANGVNFIENDALSRPRTPSERPCSHRCGDARSRRRRAGCA